MINFAVLKQMILPYRAAEAYGSVLEFDTSSEFLVEMTQYISFLKMGHCSKAVKIIVIVIV